MVVLKLGPPSAVGSFQGSLGSRLLFLVESSFVNFRRAMMSRGPCPRAGAVSEGEF